MRIAVPFLSLTLFAVSSASAADLGTLLPGKPAGVRAAQSEDINPLFYFGAVAVGIGIALAVSDNSSPGVVGGATVASTSTTG
jgi:hypothetical protein